MELRPAKSSAQCLAYSKCSINAGNFECYHWNCTQCNGGTKEEGEVLVIVGNFCYIIYDTISFLSLNKPTRKALESGWVRRQRWKHFLSHEELLTQMIFNGIIKQQAEDLLLLSNRQRISHVHYLLSSGLISPSCSISFLTHLKST